MRAQVKMPTLKSQTPAILGWGTLEPCAPLESYRYAGDRDGIGIVLFAMLLGLRIHVVVLGFC